MCGTIRQCRDREDLKKRRAQQAKEKQALLNNQKQRTTMLTMRQHSDTNDNNEVAVTSNSNKWEGSEFTEYFHNISKC